jgi:hypothetical protein
MTFAELELLMAIRRSSKSGKDLTQRDDRFQFAKLVAWHFADVIGDVAFPFTVDDVMAMQLRLRKNKVTKLKADVALKFGTRCFWLGRNKGPCSEIAELGHIVPKCEGGSDDVSNLMIECRSHNNQRRERSIEDYLSSHLITPCVELVTCEDL